MQVKGQCLDIDICIIVLGCIGEDFYDVHWLILYIYDCAEVSSYIDSYKDVDIFEGCGAIFCVLFLDTCV